jgi:hypothetical protein
MFAIFHGSKTKLIVSNSSVCVSAKGISKDVVSVSMSRPETRGNRTRLVVRT